MIEFIRRLYTSSNFMKFFIYAFIILVVIFLIILFLGIHDQRKTKRKLAKEQKKEEITFDNNIVLENNYLNDVTFEIPSLTQNLKDFKKNIEQAMKEEVQDFEIEKIEGKEDKKQTVILDKESIDSTPISINS